MGESYTTIQDATSEKMSTINEPKVLMRNYILPPATDSTLGGVIVGDGLKVDNNGKISATGQKKTSTIELSAANVVFEKPNEGSLGIYDASKTIPLGVEIAKVEGTFDGVTWFDFKRIYETEPSSPYFFANTHTFNDESVEMFCILSITFASTYPSWANRVFNYELQGVKLTYYTN